MKIVFREETAGPSELLARLSRRRWEREFAPVEAPGGVLEVYRPTSLAAPGSARALAEAAGRQPGAAIVPSESDGGPGGGWDPPAVSTLAHFEAALVGEPPAGVREIPGRPEGASAAFLPEGGAAERWLEARGFRVLRIKESFGAREEILREIPAQARRLLDVGCGAGETAGEARRRIPGLYAAGIEREPGLAARARRELDLVIEDDALAGLARLSGRGARFDALVCADILEHLADPFEGLAAVRRVAEPGALLVASVPNAAAFPLVEDLVAGRFDPIGAGIEDAGHLRWFTRATLSEMLEECGFEPAMIVPARGVAESGAEFFAALAGAGIAHDREEMSALQWIAAARAR